MAWDTISGTVMSKSGDGKRFKLDNGEWYGVYFAKAMQAEPGDMVSFEYQTVHKDGKDWHNVKSPVVKPIGTSTSKSVSTDSPTRVAPATGQILPVNMATQRVIVRQNAAGLALTAIKHYEENHKAGEFALFTDFLTHVIDTARMFEEYTSGDGDIEEARVAMELQDKSDG